MSLVSCLPRNNILFMHVSIPVWNYHGKLNCDVDFLKVPINGRFFENQLFDVFGSYTRLVLSNSVNNTSQKIK